MNTAKIVSIQIGMPKTYGSADAVEPMDKSWTSGISKSAIAGRKWLGELNLDGDGQADLVHHGGAEKAVNVYAVEPYDYWRANLNLPEMRFGAFGENFTTEGLLESVVCIGDVFAVGDAIVQISQPRQPCWKLARRWRIKDLAATVQRTGLTGWYFRVLQPGYVETGAHLTLLQRLFAKWTISLANEIMHHRKNDFEAAQNLADCAALSANWRESLLKRADAGKAADTSARLFGNIRNA